MPVIAAGLRGFAVERIESEGERVIAVTATPQNPGGRNLNLPSALHEGDERLVLGSGSHFNLASAENTAVVTGQADGRQLPHVEVRGVTSDGIRVLGLVPRSGRTFTADEHEFASRVAVVGAQAARDLFDAGPPLGRSVDLGGWPFRVVGVLAWAGRPGAGPRSSLDDAVFVPFSTGATAFHGTRHASTLRFRLVAVDRTTSAAAAADAVAIIDRARIQRGEGSLRVTNTVAQMARYRQTLAGLRAVAVLVCGAGLAIGVMGIAGTLAAPAGLVGALVAFMIARIAVLLPFLPVSARPNVPLSAGVMAAVLVLVTGGLASLTPARQAAAIPPAPAAPDGDCGPARATPSQTDSVESG